MSKYTKKDFRLYEAYEKVRTSGKYNMVTDWALAAKEAGLTQDEYMHVIRHYSHIKSAHEAQGL